MTEEVEDHQTETNPVQAPRPSSPRKFFARIYGHLEEPKNHSVVENVFGSESSSDVEVEERVSPMDVQPMAPPMWPSPPPLPLCPRPILLPHQQLAFGAGLAAFCK